MNRVIKFRAWDGGRMIMPEEKSYYQHYMSFCGNIVQSSHEGMACFGGQDSWRLHQKLQLMQFTGLCDKNGAEVYESDVVQDHNGVGVVEWHDSAFRVNYHNGCAKWFYDYTLRGERESIEVIGNVHQHPELLK
jgi:uncharacterized phage protein (TIGR01671 family)